MRRWVNRWIVGFVISILIIWLISSIFHSGVSTYTWDALLERYMYTPDHVRRWRSEGWADTYVGRHQFIAGEDDIAESDKPKIIIWGDSHVEALQVPNSQKISSQYNQLAHGQPYWALSVGGGGRGIGDIFYDIKPYSETFKNIQGNVIVLSGMGDVLPGSGSGLLCKPLRIQKVVGGAPSWKSLMFGPIFAQLRLGWAYDAYRRCKENIVSWFLSDSSGVQPFSQEECPIENVWDEFLPLLEEQSEGFLIFIYCPQSPMILDGVVLLEDPADKEKKLFKAKCEEFGIGFVDLSLPFADLYLKENSFPRGFFNMPPGLGHMNEKGLEVVAKELYSHISGAQQ